MRRTAAALAATAVGAILALSIPAGAAHTNQTDANDASGRLDVKAVEFDHDAGPLRWRIVTFATWTVHDLWDQGYLVVELDTKGDEAIDFLAVVWSDGRQLAASLFALRRDGSQKEIGELPAGKDGRRAVEVFVALGKLTIGPNRTTYHWSVLSSFTGSACPRTCLDRIPDEGMVEQLLPGVTPTPTPSPSVTPTPTP